MKDKKQISQKIEAAEPPINPPKVGNGQDDTNDDAWLSFEKFIERRFEEVQ